MTLSRVIRSQELRLEDHFIRDLSIEVFTYSFCFTGDTTLGMKELGIQSHHGPMCPQLSTVESRLRTFSNWPDNVVQRPEELAAAGFYYTGTFSTIVSDKSIFL